MIALTRREKQIVILIAYGKSVKQIADTLYISDDTVKTHLRNIYTKIGGHKESDVTRYYFVNNYITAPPVVRKYFRLYWLAFEPNITTV